MGPAQPPVPRPGAVPARAALGGAGRRGPRRGHVRLDRRAGPRACSPPRSNAVLAAYDCAVTVLYHDTEVQKVQTWQSADGPLVLDPVGGGGTSHACVFDWLDRSGLDPACVVCLTDLDTEFPPGRRPSPSCGPSPAGPGRPAVRPGRVDRTLTSKGASCPRAASPSTNSSVRSSFPAELPPTGPPRCWRALSPSPFLPRTPSARIRGPRRQFRRRDRPLLPLTLSPSLKDHPMIILSRAIARAFRSLARKCVPTRTRGPAPPVTLRQADGRLTLKADLGEVVLTWTGPAAGDPDTLVVPMALVDAVDGPGTTRSRSIAKGPTGPWPAGPTAASPGPSPATSSRSPSTTPSRRFPRRGRSSGRIPRGAARGRPDRGPGADPVRPPADPGPGQEGPGDRHRREAGLPAKRVPAPVPRRSPRPRRPGVRVPGNWFPSTTSGSVGPTLTS